MPSTIDSQFSSFVNFALNKPCAQSSALSAAEQTAERAVDGIRRESHAFHTSREPNPWWQVDLGATAPIQAVVVYNVAGKYAYRAAHCTIKLSTDGISWRDLYSATNVFGGEADGTPLVLRVHGMASARYIRVQLIGRTYLHLSQVQVFAKQTDIQLSFALAEKNVDAGGFFTGAQLPYSSMEFLPRVQPGIEALHVIRFGRFGNVVVSLANALAVARRLGVKKIFLNTSRLAHGEFDLGRSTEADTHCEIVRDDADSLAGASVLAGTFFAIEAFPDIKSKLDPVQKRELVQRYVVPKLNAGLRRPRALSAEAVVAHFRSGDIFNGVNAPSYRQPPLEYYKLALQEAIDAGCRVVWVLFEDKSNPTIEPFIRFCQQLGISVEVSQSDFLQDLSVLMSAQNMICPRSTLTEALLYLAFDLQRVWIFEEPQIVEVARAIVRQCRHVRDSSGGYTKIRNWKNSEEQRLQLINYARENLSSEMQ